MSVRLAGLSAQTLEEQIELSERLGLLHPVACRPRPPPSRRAEASDIRVRGRDVVQTGDAGRRAARITKVFYPVFPPDRNAEEVVAWLGS